MIPAVMDAIVYRLDNDAALKALMGKSVGDHTVYRAQRQVQIKAPSITVRVDIERSTLFPGEIQNNLVPNTIISEEEPTIQVDVWVSSNSSTTPMTGEDADAITQRVDVLLFYDALNWVYGTDPTTGARTWDTHAWSRVSFTQQYEEQTNLWHNAMRYSFNYHLYTGYVLG